MNKKIFSMAAIVIAVIAAAAFAIILTRNSNPEPQTIVESFEESLGAWEPNADVPLDPNNPGNRVQWSVKRASNVSRTGMYSAEFSIDGRQDDGTVWLERKLSVKPNTRVTVNVSLWLYSELASFNTLAAVVASAGAEKPAVEADFAVLGAANEAAGWKEYAHIANLDAPSNGEVWVSVGISVRWETQLTYYVDDVKTAVS
jgi:hypothetical protein